MNFGSCFLRKPGPRCMVAISILQLGWLAKLWGISLGLQPKLILQAIVQTNYLEQCFMLTNKDLFSQEEVTILAEVQMLISRRLESPVHTLIQFLEFMRFNLCKDAIEKWVFNNISKEKAMNDWSNFGTLGEKESGKENGLITLPSGIPS